MESTSTKATEYEKVKTLKRKLTDILDKEDASIGEVLFISHHLLLDALKTVIENDGETKAIQIFKDFIQNSMLAFRGEVLSKTYPTKH